MKLNLPRRRNRRLPDYPRALGDPRPGQPHRVGRLHGPCAVVRAALAHLQRHDFNRESLRIEIDTSLPSPRVIRALVELRGAPQRLRLDNGPEFVSAALRQWAQRHDVESLQIQPCKPTQNAYIERFYRTFRTEVLDRYVFISLHEVRRMIEGWHQRYNHQRPHRALGGLSPVAYAMASPISSTSQ